MDIDDLVKCLFRPNGARRAAAASRVAKPVDESTLAALCSALGDDSSYVRRSAGGALRAFGETAVPHLCQALRDRSVRVRTRATLLIGEIGPAHAMPALLQELRANQPEVAAAIAVILGTIEDERVLPALLAALQHPEAEVRAGAALGLGTLADSRAVPPLCRGLRDERASVRKAVVEALRRIADRAPCPELRYALPELRRLAAQWALRDANRDAYVTTIARIERVTAAMRHIAAPDLPLPSTSGTGLREQRPIPAPPPALDPACRPLPTAAAAD